MNQVHVHQRQANANDSPSVESQRVYNLCTQLHQPKPCPSGLTLALGVEDEGNNEPVNCQQLVHCPVPRLGLTRRAPALRRK